MSIRTRVRRAVRKTMKWTSRFLPSGFMEGGKQLLDEQYGSGDWDYLWGLPELPRFGIVVGYCHHYAEGGSVLEIGCGEGILQQRLSRDRYSRYVGVDISGEAIERASARQDEKTDFVAADAASYSPSGAFDVIVFNEVLEYFPEPLGVVSRYDPFLTEGGVIVVSMFAGIDTARSEHIWKLLATRYRVQAKARVATIRDHEWNIRVLTPNRVGA